MQVLTSFILAAFVGYVGAWYFGMVEGNFALLLFLATVVTGVYWLAERFYFLPQRRPAATLLVAEVRSTFDKAAAIDNITSVSGKDLDVTKEGDKVVASFAYQREIHLTGPAFLTLKYTGRSRSPAGKKRISD